MNTFKFLNKNKNYFYQEYSDIALSFFYLFTTQRDRHGPNVQYNFNCNNGEYRVVDYRYSNGEIIAGRMDVYPSNDHLMKISFGIRHGQIVRTTVSYWNEDEFLFNLRERPIV